jgi:uncharacterized delta-60 repeat protein
LIAFWRSLGFATLAAALVLTPLAIAAGGDLDRTFDGDGKVVTDVGGDDYPFDVAVQRDGKIVVVGVSYLTVGAAFWIARYTVAGALDPSFGNGGVIRPDFGGNSSGNAVIIQADGKIVVAGLGFQPNRSSDFVLARYNPDGSLDASFDRDGRVFTDFGFGDSAYALTIQPDGKIIAAGNAHSSLSRDANEFGVARYNPDGSLDASFDGDGKVVTAFTPLTDVAVDAVVQPDGKIVVGGFAGFSFEPPHNQNHALARYNAVGSLDPGFDGDGKVMTTLATFTEDVALQADGKILLAGRQVLRYNRDGSIDSGFGERAKAVTEGMSVRAVLVQPDAKIIAVGDTGTDFAIMRLDSRGNADNSFGGGRVVTDLGPRTDDYATAAALQSDRRIVVAGSAAVRGQPSNLAVARYVNPAPSQCVVPNVRRKTLRIARRALARGRCAVGRVTRKFSKGVSNGRVISQSRRPGLRLPVGSRVNLVLSKGRPRNR